MDDRGTNTERSEEEVAWDEEFRDDKDNSVTSTLSDLLLLAIRVPVALIQMPVEMLPRDTRRHARAATREGFLAVRSLLGAIGDGIESMLADPPNRTSTVSGPAGTWGTTRYAQSQTSGTTGEARVRRIDLDDADLETPADPSAPPAPTGPVTPEEEQEAREGRGLRADIDY